MFLIFRPCMLGRIKYFYKADDGDSINEKQEFDFMILGLDRGNN